MMQRAEYTIDLMNVSTVNAVADIAAACFSTPWTMGAYQRELTNPLAITLVAAADDTVLGFVNCGFVADELTINTLAVLPEHRRKGIADALMRAVFAWTKDICKICYLEVRESNIAAQTLYKRLGFTQNGYRPNYYDHPSEAAVLMVKEL